MADLDSTTDDTTTKTVVDTTLTINLSSKLQKTLGQEGVTAYAVVFDQEDGDTAKSWTKLVYDGEVQDKGKIEVPLTTTTVVTDSDTNKVKSSTFHEMNGGKVYILIQSRDPGGDIPDLKDVITGQSDITWSNSDKYQFRYDSFEVSLLDGDTDAGNLTSVNGFGLPMEVRIDYDDGSSASRSYDVTGAEVFDGLIGVRSDSFEKFTEGPLAGEGRAAISPATAVADSDASQYKASDWDAYVDELKTKAASEGVAIAGFFNGAADANGIWHNGGFYSYTLSWDEDGGAKKEGVFWLTPEAESQIKGLVQITAEDLENSIYSTLGVAGIYESEESALYEIQGHDPQKHPITNSQGDPASMNTGENNQWGAMLAKFLTGFTAGYYGGEGASKNADATESIDLDQSWNWDPTYAFGDNYAKGADAPKGFDPYAKYFFDNTNSYGSGYSDALTSAFAQGSPLISVSEPNGGNGSNIDLNLYDDFERPAGYTPSKIYNYVAPGKGGYAVDTAEANAAATSANVTMNFYNAEMALKEDTQIALQFYQGEKNGEAAWTTVKLEPGDKDTLWQNWKITVTKTGSGDDATYAYGVKATGVAQPSGSVGIENLPVAEKGVHWYRVLVGDTEDSSKPSKIFNLYAESDGAGQFVNPGRAGQEGVAGIDGLALIQAAHVTDPAQLDDGHQPKVWPTFSVDFMPSSNTAVPAGLLTYDDANAKLSVPSAPVAGNLDDGDLTALSGQAGVDGNTAAADKDNRVAFGWTGDNDLDPTATAAWIKKYTNKIGALNYAEVSATTGSGAAVVSVYDQADLDGRWTTDAKALSNGTYTFAMKEFLSTDPKLSDAIGVESASVTVNVNVAERELGASLGGEGLKLAGGDEAIQDVAGNWVRLSVSEMPSDPGAGVAVTLMDRDGNLVDARTGETGPGVTVEDATLATLGGVTLEGIQEIVTGSQSVYLPTDMRLGFVALEAAAWGDAGATAQVTPDGAGGAQISVGGHVIGAQVNNTLSDAALLADAQRVTGESFVFLRQGAEVQVDLGGESETENRLAFVRVEVDVNDGSWSVAGVDFGAAGFEAAVLDNLDADFSLSGEGDFQTDGVWTVEGETGFFAPVVVTASDEVIFAPDHDQARLMGENLFVFEDGVGDRDFDDLVARLDLITPAMNGRLHGETSAALVIDNKAVVREGARFVSDRADKGGAEYGLTVVAADDETARLKIDGEATFKGQNAVLMEGGDAVVKIGADGQLILRGEGEALSLSEGMGGSRIVNDGLLQGDVSLAGGDDRVQGAGVFDGEVRLGGGQDVFVASDDPDQTELGVTVRGNGGSDLLRGGDGVDELRGGWGFDMIKAGAGDDFVAGGRGVDSLLGQAGDDMMLGRAGDDALVGGRGGDVMVGGRGMDVLSGGRGDDVLQGGLGNDQMSGGAGADVFVLNFRNAHDTITDFEIARDSLDLTALDLDPDSGAQQVRDAMSRSEGGLWLDLTLVGGNGGVTFNDLNMADAEEMQLLL